MPSYRELLQQVKAEIDEVDAARGRELLDSADPPLLVDVREQDEWSEGHLPGAIHIPLRKIDSQGVELLDRKRAVIVYCWDTA